MLGSSKGNNRWQAQVKPGQAITCTVIAKGNNGYDVRFGSNKRGFVTTGSILAIGAEVLLQFVGYRNHIAQFNPSYGVGSSY